MKKILNPIFLSKKNIIFLNNEIIKYLYDILFNPLADIYRDEFKTNLKLNSINNLLLTALRNGEIYLKKNRVYGNFKNARLVKELQKFGIYNKRSKCFVLNEIPMEFEEIQASNKLKLKDVTARIDNFLHDFIENIEEAINFISIDYNSIINNYNRQFFVNFKDLAIKPQLTDFEVKALNEKYLETTKRDIKNLSHHTVVEIRKKIINLRFYEGATQRDIARILEKNYNLTKNRSLFIARQESGALLTEYTKNNYLKNNIRKFQWQTAADELVRDYPRNNQNGENHRYLNGEIFEINNPPIVNLKTGERGLPGEAYNCRCLMRPVIE